MSVTAHSFTKRRWLLAAGVAAAGGWAFYSTQISPLRERERTTRHRIAELSGEVQGARRAMEEMRAQEGQATEARAEVDRWNQDYPAGSATAWVPELVESHFARFGIDVAIVRLNTTLEEPELPGYDRAYWSVGMPIAEANKARASLLAAAEFEQQYRFVRLLDFAIQPDPHDVSRRIAVLNLSALIRK